jgi:hypothetical protein
MSQASGLDDIWKIARLIDYGAYVCLVRDCSGDRATDLRTLERVCDSSPEEVTHLNPDDLTLSLKPAEGTGMNKAIPILRDS